MNQAACSNKMIAILYQETNGIFRTFREFAMCPSHRKGVVKNVREDMEAKRKILAFCDIRHTGKSMDRNIEKKLSDRAVAIGRAGDPSGLSELIGLLEGVSSAILLQAPMNSPEACAPSSVFTATNVSTKSS
jgi:hypothetical protein